VTVPKGTSEVQFRYEPRAFPLGIALALTGLLGFALVWLVSLRRRRPEPGTDPRPAAA
jgi:hypothetical protein